MKAAKANVFVMADDEGHKYVLCEDHPMLVRATVCQRCHHPSSEIIGHHHSYEPQFWLDVEWLCKKCHVRHHAEENYVNQGRVERG